MHSFSQVPKANISRSSFRRNFDLTTTCDSGYLVPFFIDEVLPGDTFNLDVDIFSRLTTPIVPIMDNIYIETFFFFVPNRLVWDNFEKFMGEQKNPGDSIDYLIPQLEAPEGGYPIQSVADYMGIPPLVDKSPSVNALPFRGLNLIYNEWFRDENLQDSLDVPTGDGPDKWFKQDSEGNDLTDDDDNKILNFPLFRRGKRHDYFTSALPWPQKGEGVDLPLGLSAPVVGNGTALGLTNGDSSYGLIGLSTTGAIGTAGDALGVDVGGYYTVASSAAGNALGVSTDGENSGLEARLDEATAVTINSLREAFLLQQFLERSARCGTRYTEILRGFWNVISPDFRLQRPEFLGGSSGQMAITTVPQTSATSSTTPQANLAAFGVYADSRHGFTKSFVEHGYVFGFINIRTDLKYQQGLDRMWSRKTRYDFAWPQFAHLGEQAILNQEIYMQGTDVVNDAGEPVNEDVFGYQERYAEYRYYNSKITGKMRSQDPQSLDVWHLAQKFDNLPVLNSEFIEDRPPIARVLAVQDEPQFKLDINGRLNTVRALPVHSVPGFQTYL